MIPGGVYHFSDNATSDTSNVPVDTSQARNPLLCYICKDYFSEPCLLSCYHTFCARCLQNKSVDSKLSCPTCGSSTSMKDNCLLPPPDTVMRHLIDLANTDNPPCSNCDKRDRPSMFFCNTCGQALCPTCRENTHRAKMFSTHEVIPMSKCAKDGHRRCPVHGEQYIMFSNSQRSMLCVNCFRDTPAEARLHCVDIDTAYSQACKNLERSLMSVREIQGLVRSGVVSCRTLLEELHHNTNTEKSTIHSFCQGMQDVITKTQAAMLLEVQRQYESKERVLHSQLMSLSGVIPILQTHLLLCHTFSSMATKFQFLDLVYPMIDRLTSVSQLTQPIRPLQTSQIRTNYKSEFAQSLEPWIGKPLPPIPTSQSQSGSASDIGQSSQQGKQIPKLKPVDEGQFTNHCRSFENQMKELGGEVSGVRERLSQLQRDVAVIKRAALQPLVKRHNSIARDCIRLDSTLQRYHQELERARGSFETSWQDQLRRIRLEQDIFQSQISEVVRVRCEVKQLSTVAQELEPSVKRLSSQAMEDFSALVSAHSADLKYLMEHGSHKGGSSQTLDKVKDALSDGGKSDHYVRAQDHRIRGVISHLMEKVRTKEDHRKKSPVQEDRVIVPRELPKERKESIASTKSLSSTRGESKSLDGKTCSLYHSHSAKGSQQQVSSTEDTALLVKKCIQDHLEEQFKQKLLQGQRSKIIKKDFPDEDSDYQHISEATTARVHKSPTYHPHSDTEDSVFYPDTPSSGRRSSTDLMDRRKTLVVVINKGNRLMQKQRSWETFPPKRRGGNNSKFCRDPESFRDAFHLNGLKKADSFEGHEEAVRTLVAAVQETRTLRKPKASSAPPPTTDSAPA
ncbi:RING finger protein 207 [Halyomorpha halys]|uniref:RING finger protein 207 n=1 Tax=Halyomorpha halys TaxID=286706 RepID=UPI0006D4FF8E